MYTTFDVANEAKTLNLTVKSATLLRSGSSTKIETACNSILTKVDKYKPEPILTRFLQLRELKNPASILIPISNVQTRRVS
jgi:hypothetical protein